MDNGWIVAAGSLATVTVTSLFSLWSKRIDVEQKLNEHKLTVRSAYVNKKIEAGQLLVSLISLYKHESNRRYVYFQGHLRDKIADGDMFDDIKEAEEKANSFVLSNNNFYQLYFNVDDLFIEADKIWDKITEHSALYSKLHDTEDYTTGIENEIGILLNLLAELDNSYAKIISYVRSDLAKYDVLQ